jgi:hypothetical protein
MRPHLHGLRRRAAASLGLDRGDDLGQSPAPQHIDRTAVVEVRVEAVQPVGDGGLLEKPRQERDHDVQVAQPLLVFRLGRLPSLPA